MTLLPAFDVLRIWGICQHKWIPTAVVFLLSMFGPAVNIVSVDPFNQAKIYTQSLVSTTILSLPHTPSYLQAHWQVVFSS